ncbi:MAG: hypothetical protein CVV21_03730 [Candidatus Goldiibacteriota bacterium HGW-Goldbacteria-1]|nr:MAG: hypothetical protein CVV21_03730 [Candidatus Goldiibacteriota bacterium HGW-Goldbacteria-1]
MKKSIVVIIIMIIFISACSKKRIPSDPEQVNSGIPYSESVTVISTVTPLVVNTSAPTLESTETCTYTVTNTMTLDYPTNTPTEIPTSTQTNTPQTGEHWVCLSTSGYFIPCTVIFNNSIHGVGHYGEVKELDTTTGIWTSKVGGFSGGLQRSYHATTVYNGKIYSTGGYYTDSASNMYYTAEVYSTDVTGTWTSLTKSAEFGKLANHTCVEFNGKMWLIGGRVHYYPAELNQKIYSSIDGIVWSFEADLPFSRRYGHTCTVFDNKMWIIGGSKYSSIVDDVWNSSDGVTWNQVTGTAGIGKRFYHTSFEFKNKLWVIGGQVSDYNIYHDVWNTTDGLNWNLVTDTPEFGNRTLHSTAVADDKIWVISGFNGSAALNAIWYSNP